MNEPIIGKDFVLFLKDHGYINDDNIQSIAITADYNGTVHITVNKLMGKQVADDMLIDNIQGVTGDGADEPKGCIAILDECSIYATDDLNEVTSNAKLTT